MLLHGFRISNLSTTSPGNPLAMHASSTIGVLPTVAAKLGKISLRGWETALWSTAADYGFIDWALSLSQEKLLSRL